jgi:hypothetical protein
VRDVLTLFAHVLVIVICGFGLCYTVRGAGAIELQLSEYQLDLLKYEITRRINGLIGCRSIRRSADDVRGKRQLNRVGVASR